MTRRTALGCAAAAPLARLDGMEAPGRAGDFSRRYSLTLERVLRGGPPHYSKEMVLADALPRHVRRFTEFSGDVSGRWLEALAAAAADRRESYAPLQDWLPALLQAQKAEGYFGDSFSAGELRREDMALLWGNGRLLLGLLEHHRLTGQTETLEAARKLGDFLLRIAPRMNSPETRERFSEGAFAMGYICWTQMIEGLTALHRFTRYAPYLELARQVAALIERRPGEHAHGYLASVRGAVELYEATREPALLAQAEAAWQEVMDSGNVFVAGTIPEAWKPKAVRTEGCAEADWLRLSLQLWRLTGRLKYLEAAERTLFNEFAMNQFSTGDFGHRGLGATGVLAGAEGPQGGGSARAWWCCTLHGLRAFPEIFRHVWRGGGEALCYDLPLEGEAQARGLNLQASSALEKNGSIQIDIARAGGGTEALAVRLPSWASRIDVRVEKGAAETVLLDGWYRISRAWQPGDRLWLQYEMKTRTERNSSGRIAVFHGPWLLGVAEATEPFFFDEPRTLNRLRIPVDSRGGFALPPAPPGGHHPFAVPAARFQVQYLPGGYPIEPGAAVLRPVCEQTGFRTCDWQYWFLTREFCRCAPGTARTPPARNRLQDERASSRAGVISKRSPTRA
ncbi:MAG: beta-L-arabinofuranosidase domain-containing protein [Acidobacteriota bacterium]